PAPTAAGLGAPPAKAAPAPEGGGGAGVGRVGAGLAGAGRAARRMVARPRPRGALARPGPELPPSRHDGHQFQRPRSVIVAGSRSPRTTVTSSSTATAIPTPTSFLATRSPAAKPRTTMPMATAAGVTTVPDA